VNLSTSAEKLHSSLTKYSAVVLARSVYTYTLSEARSGVDWADLMAAKGAFGTDFYDKSTRTIVGTML